MQRKHICHVSFLLCFVSLVLACPSPGGGLHCVPPPHVFCVPLFRGFLRQQADRLGGTWQAHGLPDPFVGYVGCCGAALRHCVHRFVCRLCGNCVRARVCVSVTDTALCAVQYVTHMSPVYYLYVPCASAVCHVCHLYIPCVSPVYHLYVTCVSPVCHLCVTCMTPVCNLCVTCMSPVCPLCVTCMTPVCHLYDPCVSPVGHLYVPYVSSVCPLCVTCMSPVCHLYDPCVSPV